VVASTSSRFEIFIFFTLLAVDISGFGLLRNFVLIFDELNVVLDLDLCLRPRRLDHAAEQVLNFLLVHELG